MLRGRLSCLLLQHCSASQQQLQQCVWAAAAFLSTSSSSTAAATRPAAVQAQGASQETGAPVATPAAGAAAATGSKQQRRAWPFVKQQELLDATFEQLHKDVKQQHALHSAQAEAKLLLLITKALSKEQVQAALAAVRSNHLKRQRIRQPLPHSPEVFSALLKAGQRAGLGHGLALQLLQQAELLGLQISLNMCEEVMASCIKHQDYPSAALTWLYAKAHCIDPSSTSGEAAGQPASKARGQHESWASKSLVRLYARGMAQWLQEGGVSSSHKKRLQEELQALAQELTDRGAKVPYIVQQALQAAAAVGAGNGVSGEGKGAAAGKEKAAADRGKAPSNA